MKAMNRETKESNIAIDPAEASVSEALGSLPRVEAPGDFGMRVKARIAERRADGGGREVKIPRFAFALGALLIVSAAIVFFNFQRGMDPNVAREIENSVPPVSSDAPVVPAVGVNAERSETARIESGNTSVNSGVSVTEEAAKPAQTVAVGTNAQQPVAGQQGRTVGVGEMVASIGAEVSFEAGAWVVRSVEVGSRASTIGLKPGDSVLAVDGIRLARDTRLTVPFDGRLFLVKRPGKDDLLPLSAK